MKSVAFFDVDNTLYDGYSFTGLLENEVKAKILLPSVFQECQQVLKDYKEGKAEYETSVSKLLRLHADGLAGQKYSQALALATNFYKSTGHFYAFARPVIKMLRANHEVILVTAEPGYACTAIMEIIGADDGRCTLYEVKSGLFTGKVTTALATRHDKHDAVKTTMQNYQQQESFGFGDSESDIEMLKVVEHAICINATNALEIEAHKYGWHIAEPENVQELVTSILS